MKHCYKIIATYRNKKDLSTWIKEDFINADNKIKAIDKILNLVREINFNFIANGDVDALFELYQIDDIKQVY